MISIFWFVSWSVQHDEGKTFVQQLESHSRLCSRILDSSVGVKQWRKDPINSLVLIDADHPDSRSIEDYIRSVDPNRKIVFVVQPGVATTAFFELNNSVAVPLPELFNWVMKEMDGTNDERENAQHRLAHNAAVPQIHSSSIGAHHDHATSSVSTAKIFFYNRDEPYYEFTNFYQDPEQPIIIDNKQWLTAEHYFQSQKFHDPSLQEHVRLLPSARECFEFVRRPDLQKEIRSDWHRIKEQYMLTALKAKFSQNDKLRALLLNTGDSQLVEHTSRDNYWGDGGDGSGKNRLGELLMQVRQQLRHNNL